MYRFFSTFNLNTSVLYEQRGIFQNNPSSTDMYENTWCILLRCQQLVNIILSHEIWMLCVTVHSSLLLRIYFWQIWLFGSAAGNQHWTIWVGRANAIYSPAHESYVVGCHNTKSQLHLDTWNHYVIHFTRILKSTQEMSKQVAQIYHYR